jgi:hypothetical protein
VLVCCCLAEVSERLALFGRNELVSKRTPKWKILVSKFQGPMPYMVSVNERGARPIRVCGALRARVGAANAGTSVEVKATCVSDGAPLFEMLASFFYLAVSLFCCGVQYAPCARALVFVL